MLLSLAPDRPYLKLPRQPSSASLSLGYWARRDPPSLYLTALPLVGGFLFRPSRQSLSIRRFDPRSVLPCDARETERQSKERVHSFRAGKGTKSTRIRLSQAVRKGSHKKRHSSVSLPRSLSSLRFSSLASPLVAGRLTLLTGGWGGCVCTGLGPSWVPLESTLPDRLVQEPG